MTAAVRCPAGTHPSLTGCGSADVIGPDTNGVFDCLTCGSSFRPVRLSAADREVARVFEVPGAGIVIGVGLGLLVWALALLFLWVTL